MSDTGEKKKKKGGSAGYILVGLILAVIVYIALVAIEKNILEHQDTKEVLVATAIIPKGTLVSNDNWEQYFKLKEMYSDIVPENSAVDITTLSDKYALFDIEPNTIVSPSMFIEDDSVKLGLEDPVLVSFTAANLTDNVAGIIRAGDYIDIYSIKSVAVSEGISTKVQKEIAPYLENVYVEGVYTAAGVPVSGQEEQATVASVYTIYIDRSNVKDFFETIETSTIKVGLR